MSFLDGEEAIRVVERGAVGVDRAIAAEAEAAQRQAGAFVGLEPGLFGRHFMDFADRIGVAVPAREVPSPTTCWRRLKRWEEQDVWLDAEGLLKWEEAFLDGSFAPAKKGAPRSEKPSGARARSGWYWSTARVFHWEFGSKVPLREKSVLRRPHSPKFASPGPKAAPGRSRKE